MIKSVKVLVYAIGIVWIAINLFAPMDPVTADPLIPPFTTRQILPNDSQFKFWNISEGNLGYAGPYSIGAISLTTGKQLWQWHDEKFPVFTSGVFDGSNIYSDVYQYGIIEDSVKTGKREWTLPVTSNVNVLHLEGSRLICELHPGSVAALSTTNHRVLWETSLEGVNTAPRLQINGFIATQQGRLIVLCGTTDSVQSGFGIVLCLNPATGRILWRSHQIQNDDFSVGRAVDAKNLYVGFNNGDIAAFSLATGRPVWRQSNLGYFVLLDGSCLISSSEEDGVVHAVDKSTGRRLWSVTLSKKLYPRLSEPVLRGSDIWFVADEQLFCLTMLGRVRWTWPVQDADGTAPIFLANDFLLPVGGSLCRIVHGEPAPMPSSATSRQALAATLVSRLDTLSIVDKHRLLALGPDAFPALLAELKKRMSIYAASGKFDDYSRFSDCKDDLATVMDPRFTQAILNLLPQAVPVGGDDSVRQDLLGIVAYKGDPAITLPVFLKILRTDKLNWSNRFNTSSTALEVVRTSNSPAAINYLVSSLLDSSADPYIRKVAYLNAARTGTPAAIEAILSLRNTDRHTPSLSDVMELPKLGPRQGANIGPSNAYLAAMAKDSSGQLWGLAQSGIAGDGADLWFIHYDGAHWVDPVFTSLTPLKLGKPASFIKYVNNPDFTRDTDGDGWTDLLERRLGTNPNNADTDGDGLIDSSDKNPLTAREPRTDTELVIAAAFEAHFWSPSVRPLPVVVTFPKGMAPFELCGSNWLILGVQNGAKSPLDPMFDHGTEFVNFEAPQTDFNGNPYKPTDSANIVLWNPAHTRAKILISDYFGGLNGTGSEIELRKFGNDWIVIGEELRFES